MESNLTLEYGPVVVEGWFFEARIGYYDDNAENEEDVDCGVVFFGDMRLALHIGHYMIPLDFIRNVTTYDLWTRRNIIEHEIGPKLLKVAEDKRPSFEERYNKLLELAYIDEILMEQLYMARFNVEKGEGVKVFISHSSKDKQFAKWLSIDLSNAGHEPWLDEWEIKVGDSIPTKISDGLQGSRFVIVILSNNSTSSNWVEREWQTKYWNEVQNNEVMVLPVILEKCEVPYLLQTKKYANFSEEYQRGLEEVLEALYVEKKANKKL